MTDPTDCQLRLNNVTKIYETPGGLLCVLEDISLSVNPGETVAVVGPSGSGKSTLLNIIGSLDKPTAGEVWLGEIRVDALSGDALAEFRARRVGFVFQEHHLLPQLTAMENVLTPTLALREKDPDAEDRATELLDRLGVLDRSDAFPAQMSGGERQRIAIARAMINQPTLLLCDEPTGNLDRDTGLKTARLFLELAKERKVAVIMVTHNLELARLFQRCFELRERKLHESKRRVSSEGAS